MEERAQGLQEVLHVGLVDGYSPAAEPGSRLPLAFFFLRRLLLLLPLTLPPRGAVLISLIEQEGLLQVRPRLNLPEQRIR